MAFQLAQNGHKVLGFSTLLCANRLESYYKAFYFYETMASGTMRNPYRVLMKIKVLYFSLQRKVHRISAYIKQFGDML